MSVKKFLSKWWSIPSTEMKRKNGLCGANHGCQTHHDLKKPETMAKESWSSQQVLKGLQQKQDCA
ncbi:hypothetical protein WN943_021554 [Citrus x changshan-huyou]